MQGSEIPRDNCRVGNLGVTVSLVKSGKGLGGLGPPMFLVSNHRVEDHKQFSHTGGESHFLLLAALY